MFASFIAGLIVGLFLSWLKLRKMTMQIKTSAAVLSEVTLQQKALKARLNAANAALAMLTQQATVNEGDFTAHEGDLAA